jgi:hypothetical protein
MAATVRFKFREGTSSDERRDLIAKLEQAGADRVEPVFPDASDEELATLYSALIGEDRQRANLLRLLERSRTVEFAEAEADRRLILPVELETRAAREGDRRR